MTKKLAIVGWGKMGNAIDNLVSFDDDFLETFEVMVRLDKDDDFTRCAGADIAIEFTVPDAVAENVEALSGMGIPVVVGTTGWLKDFDRVRTAIAKNNTTMVWSPNFSVGANVFARVVREAAKLLASQPEYAAWGWEIHHDKKKDAPSGTLLKLIDDMKRAGYSRTIDASSNRAGAHPGTHEVGFDSAADTITLRHTARNRDGFARGALKAARWIVDHPDQRGVFEFSDILFRGSL